MAGTAGQNGHQQSPVPADSGIALSRRACAWVSVRLQPVGLCARGLRSPPRAPCVTPPQAVRIHPFGIHRHRAGGKTGVTHHIDAAEKTGSPQRRRRGAAERTAGAPGRLSPRWRDSPQRERLSLWQTTPRPIGLAAARWAIAIQAGRAGNLAQIAG